MKIRVEFLFPLKTDERGVKVKSCVVCFHSTPLRSLVFHSLSIWRATRDCGGGGSEARRARILSLLLDSKGTGASAHFSPETIIVTVSTRIGGEPNVYVPKYRLPLQSPD